MGGADKPEAPKEAPSITISEEMMELIQEKLRKADLYLIALATLARTKGGAVKISGAQLALTESEGYQLSYEFDERTQMGIFRSLDPKQVKQTVN